MKETPYFGKICEKYEEEVRTFLSKKYSFLRKYVLGNNLEEVVRVFFKKFEEEERAIFEKVRRKLT